MPSTPRPDFLPSDVGRLTMRGWKFPPHLQALQSAVMRLMTDDECNRLVVSMAVRHGKTTYCTWAFLTWYLLSHPNRQVILATFGKDFSNEWSQRIQATIRDYGSRLTGVTLGDRRRQDYFTLARPFGGQLRTAAPGAFIAGRGAHLILCDDLVADVREAASASRRHTLTTWVNSELLSRLEPGGKVLAVMSRRHPDDQLGRWLSQNGSLPARQRWHEFTMPAIDAEGKALWPERYPLDKLHDIKRRYELDGQSWLWDSLYQQDPRGDSSIIEWPEAYFDGIEYDEIPPDLPVKWRVLAVDPSKGRSDRAGDYFSVSDITLDALATLWVDPWLRVVPAEAGEDHVVAMLAANEYDAIIVETNGFQEMIADNVARKCREKGVRCQLFKKCNTESKEVRIRLGLGPLLEQRRIRVCARSSSYRLALAQLREFPSAAHDDFPDSLNLGIDLIDYLLTGKR